LTEGARYERLLIEPRTVEDQVPRLLLSVPKDHLQAPLDDVLSEVTILAQVERISADNESYQVIRMLKGGPTSSLEKESVAGTGPEMLPALREIGVDIDMDDIFIEGPCTDPASHLCLPLIAQRGSAIPRGPGLLQCMGSSTYCLTAERRREGTWHRGA
jgi:hypothetical protein